MSKRGAADCDVPDRVMTERRKDRGGETRETKRNREERCDNERAEEVRKLKSDDDRKMQPERDRQAG